MLRGIRFACNMVYTYTRKGYKMYQVQIAIKETGEVIDRAVFDTMAAAADALHWLHVANVNRRYEFELRAA